MVETPNDVDAATSDRDRRIEGEIVVVYTTTWCGYCHRLTSQLERAGIEFDQVDIETTPGAADSVTRMNGGNATVATVVCPDDRQSFRQFGRNRGLGLWLARRKPQPVEYCTR